MNNVTTQHGEGMQQLNPLSSIGTRAKLITTHLGSSIFVFNLETPCVGFKSNCVNHSTLYYLSKQEE